MCKVLVKRTRFPMIHLLYMMLSLILQNLQI